MAQFTNQALLTFRNTVTGSNIAVGEIIEVLSLTKTAVKDTYVSNETLSYVINIINSGSTAFNNLTVTDDLGTYEFGTFTLTPLEYSEGTARYFINGILQPAPTVTQSQGAVTFSGFSLPAGSNGYIVYEARVNDFAPINEGGTVTNTATLSGGGTTPISDSATVTASSEPTLSLTKSISPVPVAENSEVTYTIVIQNTGSAPVVATDDAFISDTFSPIIDITSVTLNGTALSEGTDYTYNGVNGEFTTTGGVITVPAATFTQDPASGAWSVTPGESVLVITGTI